MTYWTGERITCALLYLAPGLTDYRYLHQRYIRILRDAWISRLARSVKSRLISTPRICAAPRDSAARSAVPDPQVGSSTKLDSSTNILKKCRKTGSGFVDMCWLLSVGAAYALETAETILRSPLAPYKHVSYILLGPRWGSGSKPMLSDLSHMRGKGSSRKSDRLAKKEIVSV